MGNFFQNNGFQHCPQFYSVQAIADLKSIIDCFHAHWLTSNQDFYHNKAVNSAYLTKPGFLNDVQRLQLFSLIGHLAEQEIVRDLLNENVCFMNTQLFFNPCKTDQKNYWHRDVQYSELSEIQQRTILDEKQILHFRIALQDEPGIELIPGTHTRWDTPLESSVRLALNGSQVFDDLPNTTTIPLKKGDMLVFSANMIHRGLYGMNRLALDILLFNPAADLQDSVQLDNLPDQFMMQKIEYSRLFSNSLNFYNTRTQ